MLPAALDFKVTYGLCLLDEGCTVAEELVAFILGVRGQRILQRMGMLALD
ncbi:molybdate ABC transporter periplasmic molybdate-binding protein [Serratia fonticola]|uniref:Molybdate ABC transporter periplasmic molybdate-binding protein n=2 Tax=Serratia fonticola TaxID=47917 RepID=A0A448SGM9_SERFO|nr:molybdate ABC transporter periplasmic molybdate-binding protein [Serratia fonticola]